MVSGPYAPPPLTNASLALALPCPWAPRPTSMPSFKPAQRSMATSRNLACVRPHAERRSGAAAATAGAVTGDGALAAALARALQRSSADFFLAQPWM